MEYAVYARQDLEGVVRLCDHEGWPSFGADPERAHRVLTAPGVTAVVARDGSEVVGSPTFRAMARFKRISRASRLTGRAADRAAGRR